MFRVLVESGVMHAIDRFPSHRADAFRHALKALGDDPFPGGDKKAIRGAVRAAYRLRVGDYRLFYVIDEEQRLIKVTELLTAEQAHKKYKLL